MKDTSFRLARADDRACINAVVHRYAHNAREGLLNGDNLNEQFVLFTEDAVVILPNDTQVPITSIADVIRGEEAKYIRHHITTVDIRFDGEDEARVESGFIALTNEASPDHWGCWRDRFEKQGDGSWLIRERAIVVDGAAPGGWFGRLYASQTAD